MSDHIKIYKTFQVGDRIEPRIHIGMDDLEWEVVSTNQSRMMLKLVKAGYIGETIGKVSNHKFESYRTDLVLIEDGLDRVLKKL